MSSSLRSRHAAALREMATRPPITTAEFIAQMRQPTRDTALVERVLRELDLSVWEGSSRPGRLRPTDILFPDLGIGLGDCLELCDIVLTISQGRLRHDQEPLPGLSVEGFIHWLESAVVPRRE